MFYSFLNNVCHNMLNGLPGIGTREIGFHLNLENFTYYFIKLKTCLTKICNVHRFPVHPHTYIICV